jgi:CRISPR-associated protein Cst2
MSRPRRTQETSTDGTGTDPKAKRQPMVFTVPPVFRQRNLYLACLTRAAPSSNCRGMGEGDTRSVLQHLLVGDEERVVITSLAIRSAERELLREAGYEVVRYRWLNAGQLAVYFTGHPDIDKHPDAFLFGYMLVNPSKDPAHAGLPGTVHSLILNNHAVSLAAFPPERNTLLQQSPLICGEITGNAASSAPLDVETIWTAFQYPVVIPVGGVEGIKRTWVRQAIKDLGELRNVAGNHARTVFDMAPVSFLARLTPRRSSEFDYYGWQADGTHLDIDRILDPRDDLPGHEMWLAGEVVRRLDAEKRQGLEACGVHLFVGVRAALEALAEEALPSAGDDLVSVQAADRS